MAYVLHKHDFMIISAPRWVSLVLLVGISAACAASSTDGIDVQNDDVSQGKRSADLAQMNDLSVLYPLPISDDEWANGYVNASSVGKRGILLPANLYTSATGEAESPPDGPLHPGLQVGMPWSTLKVVAFRIDPCFANIGPIVDEASCKNQLRLVLQSVKNDHAVDGAVHAFYSLTRDELVTLLKSVIALRKSQATTPNLGALAVHPIMNEQRMLGAQAKGLNELVLTYAGQSNLTRFTVFTPANLGVAWDFQGFDVADGQTTSMIIPTLPGTRRLVSFFFGNGRELEGVFDPPTTHEDNIQLLGDFAKAKAAPKTKLQAAFDAALRIENPNFHSPDTIDCASCHVAGPSKVLTGERLGLVAAGNPNAFVPDSKFVGVDETKQTTPVNDATKQNVHAFSYRDNHPMIAMRVINETAAILAYVNAKVLAKRSPR